MADNKLKVIMGYSPDARQDYLNKAAEAYIANKEDDSIFFQVQAAYSMFQDRYFHMSTLQTKVNSKYRGAKLELKLEDNVKRDKLIQYAVNALKQQKDSANESNGEPYTNFLQGITDPKIGFQKIIEICKQFPDEWAILQVSKGPRPQTTYSDFEHIHEYDSDIYLTLLRHARSSEYPEPICIRFSDATQVELFKIFSKISKECKDYMGVNARDVSTYEEKAKYWENLKSVDYNIRKAIMNLKQYIYPWIFLFKGIPRRLNAPNENNEIKGSFIEVDKVCETFQLTQKQRILLSLACLHISELDNSEIEAICEELIDNREAQAAALRLMLQLRQSKKQHSSSPVITEKERTYSPTHYPCILIVHEHLDHFYWEELNVPQEMCRANSLHCLWKLFNNNKSKIRNGYLCTNITKGGCILNPDSNLPKTEMRLRAFFEYWTPSWLIKCQEKPTLEELQQEFFKRNCYVYAGHGSGLQHISGKHISKQQIDAVVFLFGCDSTRMHSNGLYSDLTGPHIYYQAAMCPCLVGAILPALDSQMDGVAVELLSRWIAPDSKEANWQQIDLQTWTKKGIIQQAATSNKEEAKIGSICGVLTRIHSRGNNKYYYNTVPYVCRGLPVWNCDVQPLPE